ncbi:MAG: hypothetical protein JSV86_03525 [Gemmatimonadota bacterium]|nr:MAG: hypothetical protein JSV86_03525 [Gemmatimonadota bacterium]
MRPITRIVALAVRKLALQRFKHLGAVSVLSLVVWSCADPSGPIQEAQAPSFAASGTPNEPWVAHVVGGLILIDDLLAHVDISPPHVNVQLFSDGSVRGSFKGNRVFVDPIFADIPVLMFFNITEPNNAHCMVVDGNQVWIGIIDDGVRPFSPSGEVVFIIVDNGDEGIDISNARIAAADCVTRPEPDFPFTTFTRGDLKIMQR